MAYSAPFNHTNRSPQLANEHQPSPWLSREQPRHQNNISVSSNIPPPTSIFEPESDDSDVSNIEGDFSSAFALPINLPPAPSKQASENPETISAHLHELERVEDHNVKKQKRLQEKRKRKDDRIAYQRAIQDEKFKAIMDARVRRDSRIKQRRERENIAYQSFFEELEEVETRLRQRLKRLKRGLPVEDPTPANRRVSMTSANSMSPSGPAYSTIPPPAKRHQTSHPSTSDLSLLNRAPEPNPYAAPPLTQPSYQFYPSSRPPQPPPQPPQQPPPQLPPQSQYQPQPPPQQQSSHPPPTAPYHANPMYAPAASPTLPPTPNIAPPRHELNPYPPLGPHGSPHLSKAPPQSNTHNQPPPRHPSASYDTRPPPPPGPPSSGFATINQPLPAGFPAVNSRPAATPPIAHTAPVLDHAQEQQSTSVDRTPSRGPPSEEKSVTGGNGTNKRTPSTTHPYQMSEAFANRHHHCERIDTLNRGIWTWYGPNATSENPVTAPIEMYLKCNHDGCGRIDWRTVHGLQCHIVKNHEQPKGTIGSLEKALERYGVPVSHIEEIERRDGLGSGGTMADPKNIRIKSRMRDSGDRMDFVRRHTPSSIQKSHTPGNLESPIPFNGPMRPSNETPTQSSQHREQMPKEGSVHSPIDLEKPPQIPRPSGGFAAVNSWPGINKMHGTLFGSNKAESKEDPGLAMVESTQSVQKPPSKEVQGPSLPPWQTPPEALKPIVQHSPAFSDRVPHQPSPNSGEKMDVGDNRSVDRTGKVGANENLRNSTSSSNRGTEEIQHQSKTENTQEVSQVVSQTQLANPQAESKGSETRDTVMTDLKVEEETANGPETESRDTEPYRTHDPDYLGQDVSPRITTESSSVQNTPRRRREEMKRDETSKNPDRDNTRAISTDDDARMILRSPEVLQKRAIPSRRESRRSSMTTAASSRLSIDKMKEDDNETVSTINTASKADSVDDDSDSITVAPRFSVDRQRDRERGKDIPKRQANGRYARKERR